MDVALADGACVDSPGARIGLVVPGVGSCTQRPQAPLRASRPEPQIRTLATCDICVELSLVFPAPRQPIGRELT